MLKLDVPLLLRFSRLKKMFLPIFKRNMKNNINKSEAQEI